MTSENQEPYPTVEYNGQTEDMYSPEGRALMEQAVRGAFDSARPRGESARASDRQLNMLAQHIEMDERVGQVHKAITRLAELLDEDAGVSASMTAPMRVVTHGLVRDAELSIKIKVKPVKVQE